MAPTRRTCMGCEAAAAVSVGKPGSTLCLAGDGASVERIARFSLSFGVLPKRLSVSCAKDITSVAAVASSAASHEQTVSHTVVRATFSRFAYCGMRQTVSHCVVCVTIFRENLSFFWTVAVASSAASFGQRVLHFCGCVKISRFAFFRFGQTVVHFCGCVRIFRPARGSLSFFETVGALHTRCFELVA